jgi:phosphomannomutase/phosphoglucomutase
MKLKLDRSALLKHLRLSPQGAIYFFGAVFFFGMAAAAAVQIFFLWRQDSSRTAIELEARRLVEAIAAEVNTLQTPLKQLALNPALAGLDDPLSTTDPATLLPTLQSQLNGAVALGWMTGADIELAGAKLREAGFTRAELYRQAYRQGQTSPAQLTLAGGRPLVLIAEPVRRGGEIKGVVLAEWSAQPLRQLVESIDPRGGMIGLYQRTSFIAGQPVFTVQRSPIVEDSLRQLPVAGTALSVGYGVPELLPFPLGDQVSSLLILLIAGLAGGIATVLRGHLRSALDKMRDRFKKQETYRTLSEQLAFEQEQAAKKAAARAGKSPSKPIADPAPASAAPGEAAAAPAVSGRRPTVVPDRSIFRAYDIRGVVGAALTPEVAEQIGLAVGSEVRARNLSDVVVARDGRLSGPDLVRGLIKGLRATGCDVIDVGAVPTPLLYFATHEIGTGSGVMVTGSHNPPDYNGFKIMVGGETLSGEKVQDLYARIAENRFIEGAGAIRQVDVVERYIDRVSGDVQLETPLHVILDAGNGIPGAVAPRLFEAIGCQVTPLYCEVDGNFPNHHPDPSDPHNLTDLIMSVKQTRADIGLAFDGDGDRLGVVLQSGEIVYPDRQLMLFAQDVLSRNPGSTVIYDVKCTGALAGIIRAAGGVPMMWKTGHSLIKAKMKETEAQLAGEMSGHFFFKERWYGFDDGMYAGCRLLEIIASSGLTADELFAELPKGVSTPELKVQMSEGAHYVFIERFQQKAKFDGARISNIDGIRADWDDGWGLVRASNTTPILVLRFDARDTAALQRIQEVFRQQLLAIDPTLKLPF